MLPMLRPDGICVDGSHIAMQPYGFDADGAKAVRVLVIFSHALGML